MEEREFAKRILDIEDLNILLNEKRMYYNTDFHEIDLSDTAFIDYLSPLYYKVFLEILNDSKGNTIILLLNKKLLCNSVYRDKIIDKLFPFLETTYSSITSFESSYKNLENMEKSLMLLKIASSRITSAVLSNFHEERVVEMKEKIVPVFLRIQDDLRRKNLSKDLGVRLYLGSINNFLKSLKLEGELKETVNASVDQLDSKINISNYIGVALLVLSIIVFFLKIFAN